MAETTVHSGCPPKAEVMMIAMVARLLSETTFHYNNAQSRALPNAED